MSRFLRATRKNRWIPNPGPEWLEEGEVALEALLDLEVKDDTLSVYKVESEVDIERVCVAIALKREGISNFDYVVFSDDELIESGIVFNKEIGETPDRLANELHYDLMHFSVRKLCLLAHILSVSEHKRIRISDVRSKLKRAIVTGEIELQLVPERLLEKLGLTSD